MLRILLKYIKYLLQSNNIHAIQGPFVFNFIAKITENRKQNCQKIEELRSELSKENRKINILDFGAGSNINKNTTRKIKDIVNNSAKNKKFGNLLYQITRYSNSKKIIELGTSLGISSSYLALGNPNGTVFTFEGCPETAKAAQKNFKELNINNIQVIIGEFSVTLKKELKNIGVIDFAFIDGNHQEKATISYFEECLKHAHNETVFVFDDIHWSRGMENAWEFIKKHPKTTVTIDLFVLGIVFIKSELSKENFKIRF